MRRPGTPCGGTSMQWGTTGVHPQSWSTESCSVTAEDMLCVQKTSGSMRMPYALSSVTSCACGGDEPEKRGHEVDGWR